MNAISAPTKPRVPRRPVGFSLSRLRSSGQDPAGVEKRLGTLVRVPGSKEVTDRSTSAGNRWAGIGQIQ